MHKHKAPYIHSSGHGWLEFGKELWSYFKCPISTPSHGLAEVRFGGHNDYPSATWVIKNWTSRLPFLQYYILCNTGEAVLISRGQDVQV